ncbi:hypothetical protein [Paenimyroides aestuarii]|uniref:DUF3575 domain-containing protein n=1 Tax=Paenimyroides aestuarii TaxID=2968490 RepID=A0ABY5NP07_9FLAO|nr:hypothetical protein [Paenimyroides aestuarii]UUV20237.1 hypothetical protein NPX36_07620 [Paenimyroides aestuarii]
MVKKTLLFVLFSCNMFAQEFANKHTITLGLINQIALIPRFDIGYFRALNEQVTAGITLGYGTYELMTYKGVENTTHYKLFEMRPEIMLLRRTEKKSPHYLSAEFFYIHHTDRFSNGYFYNGREKVVFDDANYTRNKMGFNLNYGIIASFVKSKKFGIIPEIGMGFKHRQINFSNIKNAVVVDKDSDGCFPISTESLYHEKGVQNNFNFNIDLRLFYKF